MRAHGIEYRDRRLIKEDPLQKRLADLRRTSVVPGRRVARALEVIKTSLTTQTLLVSNETLIGPMPSAADHRLYPHLALFARRLKTLETRLEQESGIKLSVRLTLRDSEEWKQSVYRFRLTRDLPEPEDVFISALKGDLDTCCRPLLDSGLRDVKTMDYSAATPATLERFLDLPSGLIGHLRKSNQSLSDPAISIWRAMMQAGYPVQDDPLREPLNDLLKRKHLPDRGMINQLLERFDLAAVPPQSIPELPD